MAVSGEVKLLLLVEEKEEQREQRLSEKVWDESKKLWRIVGPAIFTRIALYSINVITQAFAGHIGDLELAAMSIANNVVVGFNFGLLLGMASVLEFSLRNFVEQLAATAAPSSALETLCGQAFGAKRYAMLGVYLQRSWIVLFLCALILSPMYFFATPILILLGQPEDLAVVAGKVAIWSIPIHFSFVFLLPLNRFLQCQVKNFVNAVASALALLIHIFISWFFISKLQLGLFAAAMTLNFSWWFTVVLTFAYVVCGGCPLSWRGFSRSALTDLWEFIKLSASSGVMLCLENWYYRVLILLTGNLKNAEIAIDAISICMSINGWELMIPLAFFAGAGVRVANELGAGNGKGAKFSTVVSVVTSVVIGLVFWVIIVIFPDKLALIFTTSSAVLDAVHNMSYLLAFTVLLNSVQPILSGVAVGSGWQSMVAFVNIGSYYLVGVPAGVFLGWVFDLGVQGIWAGMIGGTLVQTLILTYITAKCDWEKEAQKAKSRAARWSLEN